jgi:hypothetical protein
MDIYKIVIHGDGRLDIRDVDTLDLMSSISINRSAKTLCPMFGNQVYVASHHVFCLDFSTQADKKSIEREKVTFSRKGKGETGEEARVWK